MDEHSKKQRIAILNVLAGYFIKLASQTRESQREQYYDQATTNFNKADKIDIIDLRQREMTWVGKGVLLLCKGAFERADKYFDTALEANPRNTPALLGKVSFSAPPSLSLVVCVLWCEGNKRIAYNNI